VLKNNHHQDIDKSTNRVIFAKMKAIDLHTEARDYTIKHIVPETKGNFDIDVVKHLQYFALLMIQKATKDTSVRVEIKEEQG
jgi:hypothetical protein